MYARKVNKLRTTFAASIREHMVNGRIHCSFNQIAIEREGEDGAKGARFGRLSSEKPNMQQQPSRDEFASRWRSIYIPDPGLIWACLDYSQQEPRWVTEYSEKLKLPRAFEAAECYRNDPTTDNHDMMTRIVFGDDAVDAMDKATFKMNRSRCKNIYLGLCYGQGGAKLCRVLGLPTRWIAIPDNDYKSAQYFETEAYARTAALGMSTPKVYEVAGEEGQAILDQFNGNAPFIKKLARKATDRAKKSGFIRTAGGRKCRFPQDAYGNYDWTHKALNRLIQGSSADQVKRAMVELDAAGYELQLQVHDEIDTGVKDAQQAHDMAEIMRNCMPSKVPFKVDVELGPSWGEVK